MNEAKKATRRDLAEMMWLDMHAECRPLGTRTEASVLVNMVLDCLACAMTENDRVELRGLGVFETKTRKARRVPDGWGSKKTKTVPATRTIVFRPSERLKSYLGVPE